MTKEKEMMMTNTNTTNIANGASSLLSDEDNNSEELNTNEGKCSEAVDDCATTINDDGIKKSPKQQQQQGHRRSKHHSPWTFEESKALVEGVRLLGGCRWTAIKRREEADACESKANLKLGGRTAMDLKDKWRNLLQLANLPTASRRKRETPLSLLGDVLALEKKFGDTRRRGRRTQK